MKKKCGTCKLIEELEEINRPYATSETELTRVLKAQLITKTYDGKGRQRGYMGYKGRKINFCPECGKELDKKKTYWKL